MTIILDAMGSDNYPEPEVIGAVKAAKEFQEKIILVGDEQLINKDFSTLLKEYPLISIQHAPEIVEMWDKPVESAKEKPNNSMAVGIKLVKDGLGDTFVTAGNTGGAMFNALRIMGRIKGVQRPALSVVFPTRKGKCIVLDIGANADCRPEFLLQFAIMGSIYAENTLGVSNPKVGLLSNGEEEGKGNQLTKDVYQLLKNCDLNFIGNIEGKELFGGEADVVVTDGFTGNVLVKGSEAIAKMITDYLKEELMRSTRTKIGALLAKPAFSRMKSLIDPSEVGAAPLLGIDGLVFVGHGRSNARAIASALSLASKSVANHLLEKMQKGITSRI